MKSHQSSTLQGWFGTQLASSAPSLGGSHRRQFASKGIVCPVGYIYLMTKNNIVYLVLYFIFRNIHCIQEHMHTYLKNSLFFTTYISTFPENLGFLTTVSPAQWNAIFLIQSLPSSVTFPVPDLAPSTVLGVSFHCTRCLLLSSCWKAHDQY